MNPFQVTVTKNSHVLRACIVLNASPFIISPNLFNKPRWFSLVILFPFYRWESRGMGWISNSPGLHSWKTCVCAQSLTCVQLFVAPLTADHRPTVGSCAWGFSKQEYQNGLPCPPPADLPNPGIEPKSLLSPALAGGFFTTSVLCCAWSLSRVRLFATPWIAAHQSPLSMGILQARILEWVAIPSSRGFSQPRDWVQVSHIASRFLTVWATREAHLLCLLPAWGWNPSEDGCLKPSSLS